VALAGGERSFTFLVGQVSPSPDRADHSSVAVRVGIGWGGGG
jgi:hypothetical protein